MKIKSSLGCIVHVMAEFRILRARRKMKSKVTVLDFRRADCGFFKDLLGRVLWDKILEKRGP